MVDKIDITIQEEGQKIILADGHEYKLAPITLYTMALIEKELDCSIANLSEQFTKQAAVTLGKFLLALLKENYPDMNFEQASKLVVPGKIQEIFELVKQSIEQMNA